MHLQQVSGEWTTLSQQTWTLCCRCQGLQVITALLCPPYSSEEDNDCSVILAAGAEQKHAFPIVATVERDLGEYLPLVCVCVCFHQLLQSEYLRPYRENKYLR